MSAVTAVASAAPTLERLGREHPEWAPWLSLLEAARREATAPAWDAAVPPRAADHAAPGVAGLVFTVDPRLATRWVRHVVRGGAGRRARRIEADGALAVLEAALGGDAGRLDALARGLDVDPAAMHALAPLAAMPLLHACRRAWAGGQAMATWRRGLCPVCGRWPTLAEARGLERSRQLRCGPCGADWPFDWLRCPFCGDTDHVRLGALVPGDSLDTRRVETCADCRGYLKTVTTLRAAPPEDVLLLDAATVELDVAALQQGYRRPDTRGHAIVARVVAGRAPSRLPWRR